MSGREEGNYEETICLMAKSYGAITCRRAKVYEEKKKGRRRQRIMSERRRTQGGGEAETPLHSHHGAAIRSPF